MVPQLLTRRAEDFLWAAEELFQRGYREVNLNLGCPSGTVTAKGKGAGFLGRRAELEEFLDTVFARAGGPISVKTRLGVQDPEEFWALLELYNRYPIVELTIHPGCRRTCTAILCGGRNWAGCWLRAGTRCAITAIS